MLVVSLRDFSSCKSSGVMDDVESKRSAAQRLDDSETALCKIGKQRLLWDKSLSAGHERSDGDANPRMQAKWLVRSLSSLR
jgi:hypothetical protein